jgi:hypothetical protein
VDSGSWHDFHPGLFVLVFSEENMWTWVLNLSLRLPSFVCFWCGICELHACIHSCKEHIYKSQGSHADHAYMNTKSYTCINVIHALIQIAACKRTPKNHANMHARIHRHTYIHTLHTQGQVRRRKRIDNVIQFTTVLSAVASLSFIALKASYMLLMFAFRYVSASGDLFVTFAHVYTIGTWLCHLACHLLTWPLGLLLIQIFCDRDRASDSDRDRGPSIENLNVTPCFSRRYLKTTVII